MAVAQQRRPATLVTQRLARAVAVAAPPPPVEREPGGGQVKDWSALNELTTTSSSGT